MRNTQSTNLAGIVGNDRQFQITDTAGQRNKFGTYTSFIAAISKILPIAGASQFRIYMWYPIPNSGNRTALFWVITQPVSVPSSKTERFNGNVGKKFPIFPA